MNECKRRQSNRKRAGKGKQLAKCTPSTRVCPGIHLSTPHLRDHVRQWRHQTHQKGEESGAEFVLARTTLVLSYPLLFFKQCFDGEQPPPQGHEEQEIIVIEEPHARDAATRAGNLSRFSRFAPPVPPPQKQHAVPDPSEPQKLKFGPARLMTHDSQKSSISRCENIFPSRTALHCAARALAWTLQRRVLVGLARPVVLAAIRPDRRVILVPAQKDSCRRRSIAQQLSLLRARRAKMARLYGTESTCTSFGTRQRPKRAAEQALPVETTHDTRQHPRLSPRSCALASHTRHARLHHLPLQRGAASCD